MARTTCSAQFKAKLVLEVLNGEKELGTIAHENGINQNMLRGWKREFLDKVSTAFKESAKAEKETRREEVEEGERSDTEDCRAADVETRFSSGLLSPVRAARAQT